MTALLPRLKQLEQRYGSVVRGVAAKALAGMDPRYDPRRRNLFSFRQGMASLPRKLAGTLGARLWSGVRVEGLRAEEGGGFRLALRDQDSATSLRVDGAVVALPAYAAAKVLAPLVPSAAEILASIEHPPLAVVALGFLFSSTLFAQRAPDDHVLLTAYVGGARQSELTGLPRDALIAMVRAEAADLLGAHGDPVFDSVRYWRHGLPQPDLGHGARLDALRLLEAEYPGLVVTGNYVGGVATAACIDAAIAAAARLSQQSVLAARRSAPAPMRQAS